jgi:hypothetical protein
LSTTLSQCHQLEPLGRRENQETAQTSLTNDAVEIALPCCQQQTVKHRRRRGSCSVLHHHPLVVRAPCLHHERGGHAGPSGDLGATSGVNSRSLRSLIGSVQYCMVTKLCLFRPPPGDPSHPHDDATRSRPCRKCVGKRQLPSHSQAGLDSCGVHRTH